jgi:copper chaperone CopZ|tara:strand:+ start:771 stop:1199 length:429 start_codon:yes stop_codon:yes gene_type:complete
MKNILFFLVTIACFGCTTTSNRVEMVMEIEGMSCSQSCSPFIQKKLAGTEGVFSANVDFETKLGTFIINSGKVTKEEIIDKIQSIAGGQYRVVSCAVKVLRETDVSKSLLEKTPDFNISKSKVLVSDFRLPNFFKILNLLLN